MLVGSSMLSHTHHAINNCSPAPRAQQQPTSRCRSQRPPLTTAAAHPRSAQQGTQRLFLDSADIRQWEKWAPTGTLYGFTTNPLILDRDGVPCTLDAFRHLLTKARGLGIQELQCQAWGGSADALEASALSLLELDPDFITVKLPCTSAGLTAAAAVLRTDLKVSKTITGVYKIRQALIAQAVGADYVAPYLGRIADGVKQTYSAQPLGTFDDMSEQEYMAELGKAAMESALDAVAAMQAAVTANGSQMRVLVASIRDASDMATLAARGCNTFTFSPAVMEQLCCVSETEAAAADFEEAAKRSVRHALK